MDMVQHTFVGTKSSRCFMRISDDLMVSSPEFCFLQLANQLSLIELVEMGYELCGLYSLPATLDQSPPDRGFYNRSPLSTKKKLSTFVEKMPGYRGHQKAVRAIRYIQDGSASPMETKVAILLTLPYKLGGFGFSMPEMNRKFTPSKTDKILTSKKYYSGDLFWQHHNLAVEYDSNLHHTGSSNIARDSEKRNAYKLMGIALISVTTSQLYNSEEFKKIAFILAKTLNKRIRVDGKKFALAHQELRDELLEKGR